MTVKFVCLFIHPMNSCWEHILAPHILIRPSVRHQKYSALIDSLSSIEADVAKDRLQSETPCIIRKCKKLRVLGALLPFSHSVLSNCLWPHGLQNTSLRCPSLSPGVCSNSCPLSQWRRPTNLILCRPLLLPSVFPSIKVFSVSELFASGGQSIGASASVLRMNIQGWFPFILTRLIPLLPKGLEVQRWESLSAQES